jgi:peptide deformylase
MAIRNIVKEGDEVLAKVCRPVTVFDDRLLQLVEDMKDTLAKANGAGLAAPQVGVLKRLALVVDDNDEVLVLVNPVITHAEGQQTPTEGCLSVPDRSEEVMRSEKIVIEYADMEALQKLAAERGAGSGKGIRKVPMIRETITGFTAVIFQHEVDHLEGILYIDRI